MTDDLKGTAAALPACLGQAVDALPDDVLVEQLTAIDELQRRLTVSVLAILRELDGRNLARREGAKSLVAWLRARFHMSVSTAYRLVKLARALDAQLPATSDALAEGVVNVEQAWVIKGALDGLPEELDPNLIARAEAAMVAHAAQLDPPALRVVGAQILQQVAPDVAKAHERQALQEREQDAWQRRRLTFTPDRNGAVRVSALLDVETAAYMQAGIDAIAEPRTGKHRNQGETAGSGETSGSGVQRGAGGPQDSCEAPQSTLGLPSGSGVGVCAGGGEDGDERNIGQRRADALRDVFGAAFASERLPCHGDDRPRAAVTVDSDTVSRPLGIGTRETGERLTPAVAPRLARDDRLFPDVLDGGSQPFDLGEERRLFTGVLPRALVLRDGVCAYPGCALPPKWCEEHYVVAVAGWPADAPEQWLSALCPALPSRS